MSVHMVGGGACTVLVLVGLCPLVPLSSLWEDPWVAAASSVWASECDHRAEPPQLICNLKQSQRSTDTWGKIKCLCQWGLVVCCCTHYCGTRWLTRSSCCIQDRQAFLGGLSSYLAICRILSWPLTLFFPPGVFLTLPCSPLPHSFYLLVCYVLS